jgi:hypothetical protein
MEGTGQSSGGSPWPFLCSVPLPHSPGLSFQVSQRLSVGAQEPIAAGRKCALLSHLRHRPETCCPSHPPKSTAGVSAVSTELPSDRQGLVTGLGRLSAKPRPLATSHTRRSAVGRNLGTGTVSGQWQQLQKFHRDRSLQPEATLGSGSWLSTDAPVQLVVPLLAKVQGPSVSGRDCSLAPGSPASPSPAPAVQLQVNNSASQPQTLQEMGDDPPGEDEHPHRKRASLGKDDPHPRQGKTNTPRGR